MALSHVTKDAIWLKKFLPELNFECDSVPIFVDNQSAIKLSSNAEYHKRTKHIDVLFHFVRDESRRKQINILYIQSKEQLADIFTKPLGKDYFVYLRDKLNIIEKL